MLIHNIGYHRVKFYINIPVVLESCEYTATYKQTNIKNGLCNDNKEHPNI